MLIMEAFTFHNDYSHMLKISVNHWVTRPGLETVFETKMVSCRSRDHSETKMSHCLDGRDWSRDHFRDQNGLDSGLKTGIDTKMSHSVCDMLTLPGISTVDHRAKRILVFAKARVYGTFLDKDNGGQLWQNFRRMSYGLSDWIYLWKSVCSGCGTGVASQTCWRGSQQQQSSYQKHIKTMEWNIFVENV